MDKHIVSVDHAVMANAIRALAMDAVEAANSGHPGMPMGAADIATVLFTKYLKFDPEQPKWPDRDRFVLSAGHGSMLLYALLYLTGYERPTLDDIKRFRQLESPCAGHPENLELAGVETTTGPLGQGLATAVGMAIAERHLNARHGGDLVDHMTYVIAGDGCLMEGVSHEAASLAGHLKLGRLIVFWDDNHISIDGPTDLTVSDDQMARFAAHGWHTVRCDGHNADDIARAIDAARADPRPSLIACRTTIAYGAPTKAGTSASHGSPLGADEIAGARQALHWPYGPFEIPDNVLSAWRQAGRRGQAERKAWEARLKQAEAGKRAAFETALAGDVPASLAGDLQALKNKLAADGKAVATRKASEIALEVINKAIPFTIGGSADLTGSNNTKTKDMTPFNADNYGGRYIYYGVREFGMAAAMNGLALHGGVIPYGGTFLVFTDYCRPAIRLSALMRQRVIYVMTHDSIGLGEDGPTHQPIEHLASLRAMPNVRVFRPADAIETAECWELALQHKDGPAVLALTRQNLPMVRGADEPNKSAAGAYELKAASGKAAVSLIATGSEVEIALAAQAKLEGLGIAARVVSMPCGELLDAQDKAARDAILGRGTLRVGIEAASPFGWERYVGEDGLVFGISTFGKSAPHKDLYKHFRLTADDVVEAVRRKI